METYEKIKAWYGELPKWKKILAAGIFILLSAFFIVLKLYSKNFTGLSGHKKVVDAAMDGYEDQQKVLDKLIAEKKKEITVKLNQAGKIDAKTLEGRKKIEDASSMEDLDALQKELGL